MDRYAPRTITLTNQTTNDEEALAELQFDLRLALQKELRPARLKEIIRKDPEKNLYPTRHDVHYDYANAVARVLVSKIVQSNWFVIRLPPTEPHSAPPTWSPARVIDEKLEEEAMCGRYQLEDENNLFDAEFSVRDGRLNWMPRVNFSPTNRGPFITAERAMRVGHWGLIASWEKEGKMQRLSFNARAETVQTLPTFRSAFKHRRCIVPMDAFYEWSGPKSARIPHEIKRTDGKPLAMAGLWETWKSKDESESIVSYTIVITTPNEFMSKIHDQMPVILEHENYEKWLTGTPEEAAELMRPAPEDILEERLVNVALNNSRNEGRWLLDPRGKPPQETADAPLFQ